MLNKKQKLNFYWFKADNIKNIGSLLVILAGIFLWPKVAYMSSITPERIVNLTNIERINNNLNNLTINPVLSEAAKKKAEAILSSGQFQHNLGDRKFSAWIKEAGYKYSYVGENLAIDFATSEGVVDAWLNSEAHKRNILNSYYKEIGVATISGIFNGEATIVVTQIFGAPPFGVAQPRIAGIGSSYFDADGYQPLSSSAQKFTPEKLLTHSENNSLEKNLNFVDSKNSSLTSYYNEEQAGESMNNFFVQLYSRLPIKYLNYTLSISVLPFLFYAYFFSFSRLKKFA